VSEPSEPTAVSEPSAAPTVPTAPTVIANDVARYEKDPAAHIARITFDNPEKRNALNYDMYEVLLAGLADAEQDDEIKVIILRGAGGCFSTGQDMSVAYSWYGPDAGPAPGTKPSRPTQTRRLAYDKWAQQPYHRLYEHNKVIIGQIEGYALGGGLEFALSCDLTVCGHSTKIGMPAARFLGPVLGNVHLFLYRLGPTLAKDLLFTGRIAPAADAQAQGVWTRWVPDDEVADTTEALAAQVARMPADGVTVAKNVFRLIEEMTALQGSEITENISHALGSNLSFRPDEFNFVKVRAKVGTSKAFEYRDRYFDDGVPMSELPLDGD
jgi:enoyl-CoA hydratase/carnithine racemase